MYLGLRSILLVVSSINCQNREGIEKMRNGSSYNYSGEHKKNFSYNIWRQVPINISVTSTCKFLVFMVTDLSLSNNSSKDEVSYMV